jgi:hypothetical protein
MAYKNRCLVGQVGRVLVVEVVTLSFSFRGMEQEAFSFLVVEQEGSNFRAVSEEQGASRVPEVISYGKTFFPREALWQNSASRSFPTR